MLAKVIFGGGAVTIPVINVGLGIATVFVWIDRNGYTSATNSLGALGELVLETPEVDLDGVDDDTRQSFANMHTKAVHFIIQPQTFVGSGGVARIVMTIPIQEGQAAAKTIEFTATNCTGASFLAGALDFTCEMVQQAEVALIDGEQVIPDGELASITEELANQGFG